MSNSETARFRTQLTKQEALELYDILQQCEGMSLALLKVKSKLEIFVAQIDSGAKSAAYVPKSRTHALGNTQGTSEFRTAQAAERKAAQETDPCRVLYQDLIDDPEVSEELKNQLMTDAVIMDKYPSVDPRTGKSVLATESADAADVGDIDENSI